MRRRNQILSLLLVLGMIAAVKVGGEVYRWYAYADERAVLQRLRQSLDFAGVEVVRTQLRADTLRQQIGQMDRALEAGKRGVAAYDRHADRGGLPSYLYGAYRAELDRYNAAVARRNERFNEWKRVILRNHDAVQRFNAVADSVRLVANRMGDPYYPIPTPAEIAARRGLLKLN